MKFVVKKEGPTQIDLTSKIELEKPQNKLNLNVRKEKWHMS
jgi:hypothetical protein